MRGIKKLSLLAFLFAFLAAPFLHAAEFEVLDRFSVDGYSVLKGSADIPGGLFTVGASTFVVKSGNVGIGTTNPGAKLDVRDGTLKLSRSENSSWYLTMDANYLEDGTINFIGPYAKNFLQFIYLGNCIWFGGVVKCWKGAA